MKLSMHTLVFLYVIIVFINLLMFLRRIDNDYLFLLHFQ